MIMSYDNLKKLIKNMLIYSGSFSSEEAIDCYIKSAGEARAAEKAAYELWLNVKEECSGTIKLRSQLKYLKKHGVFHLTENE